MTQNQTPLAILEQWLELRLPESAQNWVRERCAQIASGNRQALYLGFGMVSRKVPRQELALRADELAEAREIRPGWSPEFWSLPDAVRMRMVLTFPMEDRTVFKTVLDRLFETGEVHELIALYQGLPLLPYPADYVFRAGEGIRTNMLAVFKAVAHHNPYPSEQLPEGMWNQMVLKCLFVGASLYPVIGLQKRNNPALTGMLCDYAHERWAARRTISPELWRCVDPVYRAGAVEDLKRVLTTGSEAEQAAAALALSASSAPAATELLGKYPAWSAKISSGIWTWQRVAESLGE